MSILCHISFFLIHVCIIFFISLFRIVAEKNETYKSYIAYVKTLLNDKKLKDCDIVGLLGVLYDRMTSECFAPFGRGESTLPEDAEQICLEYIDYAREHNSDEYCLNVIEKVTRRYHRNSTLCILKLQQLERMGKDVQEVTDFHVLS